MATMRLKNRLGLVFELEDCEGLVHVSRKCVFCQGHHTAEVDLPIGIFMRNWNKWLSHMHIQEALCQASADDREFFISSICPNCFDRICSPDVDEDDDCTL